MSDTDTEQQEPQPDPDVAPDEPAAEPTEPTEPLEGDVPDPEPDEQTPAAESDERCEAETTVGGNLYRCALNQLHDGPHSFTPVDASDAPEDAQDAEFERKMRSLNTRARNYSKGVAELLGDGLEGLNVCPCCETHWPGLIPPVPPNAETKSKLRVLIGLPSLDNYKQDPYSKPCTVCDGLGSVLTGSQVEQYASAKCLVCKGKGYESVGPERATISPETNGAATHEDEPQPLAAEQEPDPWGRPPGDPDYYRIPQPGDPLYAGV